MSRSTAIWRENYAKRKSRARRNRNRTSHSRSYRRGVQLATPWHFHRSGGGENGNTQANGFRFPVPAQERDGKPSLLHAADSVPSGRRRDRLGRGAEQHNRPDSTLGGKRSSLLQHDPSEA